MTIFLMIMLGCKVRQQKPYFMVSFCWTKPRTLQAGSTVTLSLNAMDEDLESECDIDMSFSAKLRPKSPVNQLLCP